MSRVPLVRGTVRAGCRACVVVPARDEESTLQRCLQALHEQVDGAGQRVPVESYEVLVLLNNCTDGSAEAVREWCERHPSAPVHAVECNFPQNEAHAGTARALLMDTAWQRLMRGGVTGGAMLSTDADSVVAPDWVAQNLLALERGADVVGGSVELHAAERAAMEAGVRRCYEQDRLYAELIARLEDRLDPQPGDPWPRHLDHFGSSLACTTEAYAAAGGMPAASQLEDEAFVDCVRRAGLRLRHEPRVRVFTSARMQGRAAVGMANQLERWARLASEREHEVGSARFLGHRFRTLRRLRTVFASKDLSGMTLPSEWWRRTFAEALREQSTCPGFLSAVYCDVLIAESFRGAATEPIDEAIAALRAMLA